MKITPSIEELKSIGFTLIPSSKETAVERRSLIYVAVETFPDVWKWVGYNSTKNGLMPDSISEVIDHLLEQERQLGYLDGQTAMAREIKSLLKVLLA